MEALRIIFKRDDPGALDVVATVIHQVCDALEKRDAARRPCSFCRGRFDEQHIVVAGSGAVICDRCVRQTYPIMSQQAAKTNPKPSELAKSLCCAFCGCNGAATEAILTNGDHSISICFDCVQPRALEWGASRPGLQTNE
jgi:hypothetical protein